MHARHGKASVPAALRRCIEPPEGNLLAGRRYSEMRYQRPATRKVFHVGCEHTVLAVYVEDDTASDPSGTKMKEFPGNSTRPD